MDQTAASLNFDQKVILLINHMQANGFVVQRMRTGDNKMQVVVGEITQPDQAWYYIESATPWNPKKMGEHLFTVSGPFTSCSEDYVVLNSLHSNPTMKAVYLKNFVKLQDVLGDILQELGAHWYAFYTGGSITPFPQAAPVAVSTPVAGETIDDLPWVTESAAKEAITRKRENFVSLFQNLVAILFEKLPPREAQWIVLPLASFAKGAEFASAADDLSTHGVLRQRFSRIYFQEVLAAVWELQNLKLSQSAALRAVIKAYQNDQKRNKVTESQLIDLDIIPDDESLVQTEESLLQAEEGFKTLCDDIGVTLSARLQPDLKAKITATWEGFMDTPEFLDHVHKYVRFGITGTFKEAYFKDVFLAIAHHAAKGTPKDVVMKEILKAYKDKQIRDGVAISELLDPDIYFPHVAKHFPFAPRQ